MGAGPAPDRTARRPARRTARPPCRDTAASTVNA
ncbi:hypothetical protein EES43_23305 [Streptomyces sp. ADI96-02]|nr:hypothetical protein EES43_23305 [Streptomyces sp. ADI96-02]